AMVACADSPLFVNWAKFWADDRPENDWILDQLLARGRGHAFWAAQKTGKSLVTLWMAASLATREDPIRVVYLDYEMTEDDLYERLSDMGYGPETDLSRLRYAVLPALAPLDHPEGGAALLEVVDTEQAAYPDHHVVLIIDTTSRAVAGDESS